VEEVKLSVVHRPAIFWLLRTGGVKLEGRVQTEGGAVMTINRQD